MSATQTPLLKLRSTAASDALVIYYHQLLAHEGHDSLYLAELRIGGEGYDRAASVDPTAELGTFVPDYSIRLPQVLISGSALQSR